MGRTFNDALLDMYECDVKDYVPLEHFAVRFLLPLTILRLLLIFLCRLEKSAASVWLEAFSRSSGC